MAGMKFKNGGVRAIAVPYHGGTETIGVGEEKLVNVRDGWLDDEKSAMLKDMGVTISKVKSMPKRGGD